MGALCYDHLLPVFYGGKTTWENVVAACLGCNNRKANVHPDRLHEIGMRLLRKPIRPTWYQIQQQARKYPPGLRHSTWDNWLFTGDEDADEPSKQLVPIESQGAR